MSTENTTNWNLQIGERKLYRTTVFNEKSNLVQFENGAIVYTNREYLNESSRRASNTRFTCAFHMNSWSIISFQKRSDDMSFEPINKFSDGMCFYTVRKNH